MNHPAHDVRDTHAAVDVGCEHAAVHRRRHYVSGRVQHGRVHHRSQTQKPLKREGHQGIHHDAEQAGIENRLERIGLGILQFGGVANGRFKTVGRPSGEKHSARHHRDSGHVPGAVDNVAQGIVGQGHQREEIGLDDVAGQDRAPRR